MKKGRDFIIPNANDPHLKSLHAKMIALGWLTVTDTPKTDMARRQIEETWTKRGVQCLVTWKLQSEASPLWPETRELVESLNEQEEAYFIYFMVSAIPDDVQEG